MNEIKEHCGNMRVSVMCCTSMCVHIPYGYDYVSISPPMQSEANDIYFLKKKNKKNNSIRNRIKR